MITGTNLISVVVATVLLASQTPHLVAPPGVLTGTVWIKSPETEGPNTTVFRPEGYKLPPMRGPLVKYTFGKDGTLTITGPGPTDGEVSELHDWRMIELKVFQMRLLTAQAKWSSFEIVTFTKVKLVLRGPLRTSSLP